FRSEGGMVSSAVEGEDGVRSSCGFLGSPQPNEAKTLRCWRVAGRERQSHLVPDKPPRRYRSICKILDLRLQALPDEITACHSSRSGEFGERIDVVKDAIGCSEERPLQATGYSTGGAGASEARVLDNIESASPIMPAAE
ncbi:MAG: hypothetical protein ACRED2_06040, partial [Methylocella sp.]